MSELLDLVPGCLVATIAAPGAAVVCVALIALASRERTSERVALVLVGIALAVSLAASAIVALAASGLFGPGVEGEVDFGAWLSVGSYEVPAVLLVDTPAVVFSLLAAALTALVARFSKTYLHREPGFVRFYVLLGMFAAGTQLVAFAGALDLMFAGWELLGWSSALFIGFFHERAEPARSSVRAFTTYRICDIGFLLAIVATHELIGSTRIAALPAVALLPTSVTTAIAAMFLFSALGKSAQLPFSGWLPRAMEGPTPSSALFYGGVSVHAGLYLLLRVWPMLEAAPAVEFVGVAIGLSTAVYATLVARTNSDAKGTLAHATLAQVGLMLAEICAGYRELALLHLTGHALLRVWQYLRAPNAIHDAHRIGHEHVVPSFLSSSRPHLAKRLYAAALHRWRLDERLDRAIAPVLGLARWIDVTERRLAAFVRAGDDSRTNDRRGQDPRGGAS